MKQYIAAIALGLASCASQDSRPDFVRELAEVPRAASAAARLSRPGAAEVPERPLTLVECVEVALRQSRSLRANDRRILVAQDRVDESLASVLPSLDLETRNTSRNNDPGIEGTRGAFSFGDRSVTTTTLTALVPIYDFGRSGHVREADRRGVAAFAEDSERARQEMILAVRQAYFRVLEARRISAVVEDSIRVVERQLEVARDFFEQGLVAKTDVLSIEVQLARRHQERIEAANNVALATSALNRLMSVDVTRATEIVDVMELPPWADDYPAVLDRALRDRPDLAALRERIAAARAEVEAAKAEYAPGIFAFGSLNASSDSILQNSEWATAGAGIRWNLFDGWATEARNRRAKRELRIAEDELGGRLEDAALDVRRAVLDVRSATERVPVAKKSVSLAEANLRVIRDQYGEGLVSSTDLLVEEERLAHARVSYFRALYDAHEGYARLVFASGERRPAGHGASR